MSMIKITNILALLLPARGAGKRHNDERCTPCTCSLRPLHLKISLRHHPV